MSEWKEGTIGDIADIEMGQSPPGNTCNDTGVGMPLLNGPTEFGSNHPIPTQFTRSPKKFAEQDDVLFCVRGSTTGRMNWADQRYAIGRGIAAIRHKKGPEYKYFLKAAIEFKLRELLQIATGSTFPNVGKPQILGLRLDVPPLPVQQRIAEILGSLDEKIELNRRTSATLEQMAQALFRCWFVDFDPVKAKAAGKRPKNLAPEIFRLFPKEFEDSTLGPIPKGWTVGSILEQADLLSGGTPKTAEPTFWDGEIPWASAKDVSQCGECFLLETERSITSLGLDKSATKMIPAFCSVVVARGATTGRMVMFGKDIAMNQTCYALQSKHETPLFLFVMLKNIMETLTHAAHGSVFDTITTDTFKASRVLLPDANIAAAYEAVIQEHFNRMLVLQKECITLSALRDTLLPKLMSGELEV